MDATVSVTHKHETKRLGGARRPATIGRSIWLDCDPADRLAAAASCVALSAPAILVAVGYMDPGNWATSLAGGSKFGYALLTVALLSNLMAILLQALCARLGIGAGPRPGAGLPRRISARGVVAAVGARRRSRSAPPTSPR